MLKQREKTGFLGSRTDFAQNIDEDQKDGSNYCTLDNAHKENKKAENERSFAHLLFFIFEVVVRVGLDFELG